MAKRKKLSAAKAQQREASKRAGPRHKMPNKRTHEQEQYYYDYPDPIPARGARSPTPTTSTGDSKRLTLGDRFRALPPELRAEIFACLLVRPVKWDALHRPECELLAAPHPYAFIRPLPDLDTTTCASRYGAHYISLWRKNEKPAWVDPWRSVWAPKQGNTYLCTACYDDRLRPRPFPRVRSLPCLCARRQNLQTLLVCRQWYAEAGHVFYSRNTFAFGIPEECVEFLSALAPRWRPFISKISLLALAPDGVNPETATEDTKEVEISGRALREAWNMLATLPGLSELELDAIMLTRKNCVKVFRGPALKNLRRIYFTQAVATKRRESPREFVWPRRGARIAVADSDFAPQVARAIKGWRYGWAKGKEGRRFEQAVVGEKARYRRRFGYAKSDEEESNESETENEM
ncbi:hypothetical protein F5X99DRAFT_176124 [Biscogniauxia marginata]|nr:hypothetical protein F5X99DRAFT_176124 [Biscogniauxia marginata]